MRAALALAVLTLAGLPALATGCSASPPGAERPPLERGQGTWVLRYNPPGCLADRPNLHAEVRLAAGWERISLEDEDPDAPTVEPLLEALAAAPDALQAVEGELSRDSRTWLGSHAARILRVTRLAALPAAPAPRTP